MTPEPHYTVQVLTNRSSYPILFLAFDFSCNQSHFCSFLVIVLLSGWIRIWLKMEDVQAMTADNKLGLRKLAVHWSWRDTWSSTRTGMSQCLSQSSYEEIISNVSLECRRFGLIHSEQVLTILNPSVEKQRRFSRWPSLSLTTFTQNECILNVGILTQGLIDAVAKWIKNLVPKTLLKLEFLWQIKVIR